MNLQILLQRLNELRDDYRNRASNGRSGYIDPSETDLAREEGEQNAYANVAADLTTLLTQAEQ